MSNFSYPGGRGNHTLQERALFDERTYTVFEEADLSAGSSFNIAFDNSLSTGNYVLLYFGEISNEGQVLLEIWNEGSSFGSLTDATVNNNTVGSDETNGIDVYKNITFTGDTIHQRTTYMGGDTHKFLDGYKMILGEGEYIIIDVTDESGSDNEVGLRISFIELPF